VRVAGTKLTRPADRPGQPARPVLVVRLDATLVEAASGKAQAAGHYNLAISVHRLAGAANIAAVSRRVSRHPAHALRLVA
jgi:hypothetical protein